MSMMDVLPEEESVVPPIRNVSADNISVSRMASMTMTEDPSAEVDLHESITTGRTNRLSLTNGSKKERSQARWSKIILAAAVLIPTVLVSSITYTFLKREEDQNYRTGYNQAVNTVRVSSQFFLGSLYQSVDSLSTAITASSDKGPLAATNQTTTFPLGFPYVTVPAWEALCEGLRLQSRLESIWFVPQVQEQMLDTWSAYALQEQVWLNESRAVAEASIEFGGGDNPVRRRLRHLQEEAATPESIVVGEIPPLPYIWGPEKNLPVGRYEAPSYEGILGEPDTASYHPLWMISPPPRHSTTIQYDVGARMGREAVRALWNTLELVLFLPVVDWILGLDQGRYVSGESLSDEASEANTTIAPPRSLILTPIYEILGQRPPQQPIDIEKTATSRPPPSASNYSIAGMVVGVVAWDRYVADLLPPGTPKLDCVVKNNCGQEYTYRLDGDVATFVGPGDLHQKSYTGTERVVPLYKLQFPELSKDVPGTCLYSFHIYATSDFEEFYRANDLPLLFSIVVAAAFLAVICTFLVYNWFVRRRNQKLRDAAARNNAIVASLFPSTVRDRLLDRRDESAEEKKPRPTVAPRGQGRQRIANFMQRTENDEENEELAVGGDVLAYKSKPIADLFPEVTILFMDIPGFTAWTSTREPSQVFTLLETVYKNLDEIASKRRVFKVETVGECYVAACGLPDPRPDHAVVMARFAKECVNKVQELLCKLEVVLGPETAELGMRFGMHTGPVTAGVLRGERGRFQLFGDTMNTASRMETTGKVNHIQMTQSTADQIIAAGKEAWLTPRDERIVAKGKGELQTYWLTGPDSISVDQLSMGALSPLLGNSVSAQIGRHIRWTTELLLKLLRRIEASRDDYDYSEELRLEDLEKSDANIAFGQTPPILEVQDRIVFERALLLDDPNEVDLGVQVEQELNYFVTAISTMYQDNHFHSFEHATRMALSVWTIMNQFVLRLEESPGDAIGAGVPGTGESSPLAQLSEEDLCFGLSRDPMVPFVCIFAALIHDVDHCGLSNKQLHLDGHPMANYYGSSVLEQNSLDLAWSLLMNSEYENLRRAIYKTPEQFNRFRQLLVHAVLATDVLDRDIKAKRNQSWESTFRVANSENSNLHLRPEQALTDETNRKATLVFELIMQVSDISHTMQHWNIYCKWNRRLFREAQAAFDEGRTSQDPANSWYQSELGFFDFCAIPMASKLQQSGVLGSTADEYLKYACRNREEWEQRGQQLVEEMVAEVTANQVGR